MAEANGQTATWVNALAAVMSAVAALSSLYVAHLQTTMSIVEKNVRPKIVINRNNVNKAYQIEVKGNTQYARNIDVSQGNVLEYKFRTGEQGRYSFGPAHYAPLQTGGDGCSESSASADSIIAKCRVDLQSYYYYRHYFQALSDKYHLCTAKSQTLIALVYKYIRVDYVDFTGNTQSEFIRIDPNLKSANTVLPSKEDEANFESESHFFDLELNDDDYDDLYEYHSKELTAMVADDAASFIRKLTTCGALMKNRKNMGAKILSRYLHSNFVSRIVQ